MGIFQTINDLKASAMLIKGVNMASYGDISLYDNKTDIMYPYVNFDIVNSRVSNNCNKQYTFRIYVMDRNVPFVAYNKCELILKELSNKLDVSNYLINYFTLDYKDLVNGVFADITIDTNIDLSCIKQIITEITYIILENSDYINQYYLSTENGYKFILE